MSHRSLFVGFGVASVVSILLAILAFRPMPDYPRDEPLVTKLPPNLDEWRPSAR